MGQVIELNRWAEKRVESVQAAAPLACPKCETECAAVRVDADGTTAYRCTGNGHRALTWRIDPDGAMLRGLAGNRYY